MNCDICGRHYHSRRLPFLCPVDARNQLYEKRLAHAALLLQTEQLEQQVNVQLVASDADAGVDASIDATPGDPASPQKRSQPVLTGDGGDAAVLPPLLMGSRLESWNSRAQDLRNRASEVGVRSRKLRSDLEAGRADLERRRAALDARRSALAEAQRKTALPRVRAREEAVRAISVTRYRWNRSYEAMAATRAFLCMEAAKLYGLRRLKKGSTIRYEIGGFEIVDPYSMNTLPPEVISTSLAHITHILILSCHYLAIQLPAEVTLPHRDYPRPTIFSLSSSYSPHASQAPFPGTPSFRPLILGPTSSRDRDRQHQHQRHQHQQQRLPRPRPLYTDKALPALAKEDGSTHTMFLEGVALLAYDIAWACCAQGVPIGEKSSLDDVFNIGRNLYNLLIGNQLLNNPAGRILSASSAPATPSSDRDSRDSRNDQGGENGQDETAEMAEGGDFARATANMMGQYAHGTAHTFLSDEVVQAFKLPSPNRLADRLKTRLTSETALPDWEVLDDEAWAADDATAMAHSVLLQGGGGSNNKNNNNNNNGIGSDGYSDGRTPTSNHIYGVESMATVITNLEDTVLADGPPYPSSGRMPDKPKGNGGTTGTSGWTKLRNR